MMVRVNAALNRTVVESDWRFDNLCGSHPQTQRIVMNNIYISLHAKKMTTAEVVEASVTINNGPSQYYIHPEDHAKPTQEIL